MVQRMEPSHLTWTLRLKHNKDTTLLHVGQLQPFDDIKEELLEALRQTHPDGKLDGIADIPEDPTDVILAKPKDAQDYTQGWIRLNPEGFSEDEEGSKKRIISRKVAEDSPKAAGLKEGAVLAYKFKTEKDEGLGDEDENWDVVIPSFEDTLGMTTEGDVGERKPLDD
ncbi:MAG: hypothetical protein M1828_003812 [Chrysothrix sp. TS-e1954]|nr:MAG: hypothetical protein M1828_003812 [Chrysothrix sp. TS-e1954]